MKKTSKMEYNKLLTQAIRHFWVTRNNQANAQNKTDQGNRSSVTGGKQLDGFIDLLVKVSIDVGIPEDCIYTKRNQLPGFFRPTKDWDFLIISPKKKLLTVIELKSQVGSFGNNFNNRTEEALGSAFDLWTAFRDNGFSQSQPPWLGYLILVEKTSKSTSPVRVQEPYFSVRKEFLGTSYLERYMLFCKKLMEERQYNATAFISTEKDFSYECPEDEVSFDAFIHSFTGFLHGKLNEFA